MLNKPEFREVPHEKGYPDSQQRIERDEAIDFNEGLKAGLAYHEQELAKEWVSVKDRLPEKRSKYLVYGNYWKAHTAIWGIDKRFKCVDPDEITHWMPLPKPPKGEV